MKAAVSALSALAHPGRMAIFRLLVPTDREGLAAGQIAATIGAPANTTSTNLAILQAAGLIVSRREGRHIHYAAAYPAIRSLIAYLIEDCCGGRPEICTPFHPESAGTGAC